MVLLAAAAAAMLATAATRPRLGCYCPFLLCRAAQVAAAASAGDGKRHPRCQHHHPQPQLLQPSTVPLRAQLAPRDRAHLAQCGSYRYASLQDPPNLERGAYITDYSPPEWRPYDRCRGVPGRCEGYNEPCPEDTNGLIYNEVNYLLNNLTATPNLTQLETFYDVTAINNSLSWLRSLARVPMVGRS